MAVLRRMVEDGTIFIVSWGGGAIVVLSPNGKVLRRIEVPASQSTCPAFIGRKADQFLVTTASEQMTIDQRSTDAHARKTFLFDPGACGLPVSPVVIA